MTTSIIPQQLRRGRHAIGRSLPPGRVELLNLQRAAAWTWMSDRVRTANLDVVRARAARWSVFVVPAAVYVAVVLATIGGAR